MNAKKIIFLLFVLISFILLYYYIDVLNNRESAKSLKRFFDVSSLEKIKSKYTQVKLSAVDGSSLYEYLYTKYPKSITKWYYPY